MARFKISTPVAGYTGESAGIAFANGIAEIDTRSDAHVSALSYFRSAGYGIVPLDDVEVDDAIRRATTPPADEAEQLKREIAELEKAESLDGLRKRRDELKSKVAEREQAERTESRKGDNAPDVPAAPGAPRGQDGRGSSLPAPPESDKVADWRTYATEHLGVTDAQARTMNTQELRGLYVRTRNEGTKGGDV